MSQSMLEPPALSMSGLGLLIVGLVLTGIGFANFGAAFTAGGHAILGVLIFLSTGAGCLTVSIIALLGRPRSNAGKSCLGGGRVGGCGLPAEFGSDVFRHRVHGGAADRACWNRLSVGPDREKRRATLALRWPRNLTPAYSSAIVILLAAGAVPRRCRWCPWKDPGT